MTNAKQPAQNALEQQPGNIREVRLFESSRRHELAEQTQSAEAQSTRSEPDAATTRRCAEQPDVAVGESEHRFVSRTSTDRIDLQTERVDLGRIVRHTLESIRPQARRKEQFVDEALADKPLWV